MIDTIIILVLSVCLICVFEWLNKSKDKFLKRLSCFVLPTALIVVFAVGKKQAKTVEVERVVRVQMKASEMEENRRDKLRDEIAAEREELENLESQCNRRRVLLRELAKHKNLERSIREDEKLLIDVKVKIDEDLEELGRISKAVIEADFPKKKWASSVSRGFTSLSYDEWIDQQIVLRSKKTLEALDMQDRCVALLLFIGNDGDIYNFKNIENDKIYKVPLGGKLRFAYRGVRGDFTLDKDQVNTQRIVFYPLYKNIPNYSQPRYVAMQDKALEDE